MFLREYLIIDSQNGTCRVRKTPTAGFGEYVIRLDIEIPKPAIPTFTINIPVPAAFPLNVETTAVKYGVPWALSEGIMETRSVSTDGKLQLDYTDEGLQRLYDEAKPQLDDGGWWALNVYAQKNWGLPGIFVEAERWEKLYNAEGGQV